MSARDDILTGKWQQDPDPRRQALLLGELLDRVEREHAHELAERQRAALEHGPGAHWDYAAGRNLADLIDPSADPVRPDEEPTA